jgi:transposase
VVPLSGRRGTQEWPKRYHNSDFINQKVADCTLREVKSARDAIKAKEEEVLNYFINRSTNASAESLNSKLKLFRAQLHGVSDLPFFLYRVSVIFG